MKKGIYSSIWKPALGVVLSVLLVKTFLVTSCFIPSSGMENSLYQGEGVLVNRWSYGLRLPFPSFIGYHRLWPDSVQRGDILLFNDPGLEEIDSYEFRDLFISRCIGLPGDTLMLNREMMDVRYSIATPDYKSLYTYPGCKEDWLLPLLEAAGIRGNTLVGYTERGEYIRCFSDYELYLLTQEGVNSSFFTPFNQVGYNQKTHPYVVPLQGEAVKVYPWNAVLLCNTIMQHEGKRATVKGDSLWVEGKWVNEYVFGQNYYWVSANNPINLCDSRLFGFVPESHIIGKAWRIWFPCCKERFLQSVQ